MILLKNEKKVMSIMQISVQIASVDQYMLQKKLLCFQAEITAIFVHFVGSI